MEKRVEPLIEADGNTQLMGILAAVFAIILTLVLFALWRRGRSIGRSVLFTGLSDAGKTLLFARLLQFKYVKTYTSIKENTADIRIENSSLRIVDIPGHERLRYKFFDKYKSSARGLVYVIDSVTFQKDIRDVAECLYTLLSDSAIQRNIPVLVLCNKQDQTMAKGSTVIKTLLEKEMNLLRLTKNSQLEATDASSANAFLGKQGKDFEFSHLTSRVDFAECSASCKDPDSSVDINQLNKWLYEIV